VPAGLTRNWHNGSDRATLNALTFAFITDGHIGGHLCPDEAVWDFYGSGEKGSALQYLKKDDPAIPAEDSGVIVM
jgi:hypothetical protein